jgi:hypothetical protein
LVWVGSLATAALIATAAALGTGAGQDLYAWLAGSAASQAASKPIRLGSLSVSEHDNNYQFIFPIFNSQLADQQVLRMGIDIQWAYFGYACSPAGGPVTYTYSVDHNLTLLKNHTVAGLVTPEAGVATGSLVRAIGSLTQECGSYELDLTFVPPALVLAGNATTDVLVDLPVDISAMPINASSAMTVPNFIVTKPPPAIVYSPGQDSSSPNYGSMTAEVDVQLSSGTQKSACQISSSSTC